MKILLSIILSLSSLPIFCQLKSVVLDAQTNQPIPYVNIWYEAKTLGTTTDENGAFEIELLEGETLIFSSLGFNTRKINVSEVNLKIYLEPNLETLEEVFISPFKSIKTKTIGQFADSDISFFYASDNTPEIKARLFQYESNYSETPFIKSFKFRIYSEIRNARFNIRLYAVGADGKPSNPIYHRNIIAKVEKGTKNILVDVSDLNIEFPKNGVFVAYEWLILKENKYEASILQKGSNQRKDIILYEPKVGLLPSKDNSRTYVYRGGSWQKTERFKGDSPEPYLEKYGLLAIEIILSN